MKKSIKWYALGLVAAGILLQGAVAEAIGQTFSQGKNIVNVAHRGASGYAPEHTMESYRLGKKLKGDFIEIDLQMTKDGELVAMHDEKVDRTTDGTGWVKDMTLKEIKQLDAGSWFNEKYPEYAKGNYAGLQVPTLEEVFQEFGRASNYYIETKSPDTYPGMEEKLLAILKEYKMIDKKGRTRNILIQSFSKESLLKVHSLAPNLPLVQLFSYPDQAQITADEVKAIKEYAIGLGPNYKRIDEKYVQTVRAQGLEIHPYTVNSKEDMQRLLEWGVTGVFTNYPDLFHEVIRGFKTHKDGKNSF